MSCRPKVFLWFAILVKICTIKQVSLIIHARLIQTRYEAAANKYVEAELFSGIEWQVDAIDQVLTAGFYHFAPNGLFSTKYVLVVRSFWAKW